MYELLIYFVIMGLVIPFTYCVQNGRRIDDLECKLNDINKKMLRSELVELKDKTF
jgi:hypothetical protein